MFPHCPWTHIVVCEHYLSTFFAKNPWIQFFLFIFQLNNLVLFDKPTYDKLLKEVPTYKLITPSIVSERLKVRGSLARKALNELLAKGKNFSWNQRFSWYQRFSWNRFYFAESVKLKMIRFLWHFFVNSITQCFFRETYVFCEINVFREIDFFLRTINFSVKLNMIWLLWHFFVKSIAKRFHDFFRDFR